MKIVAAALILTLSATAFAAEPPKPQSQDAGRDSAPILLGEAQLDDVTAGGGGDVAMEELVLSTERVELNTSDSEWKYVSVRRF